MKGYANIPKDKADVVYVGKVFADLPKKYKQKGCAYIQDSNACVYAGNNAIYSCNAAAGSQLDKKGRYKKNKITSGYAFNSPILVVVVPKVLQTITPVYESMNGPMIFNPTDVEVHDMDTLKIGHTGQQVKVLQKLLGGLDIDGEFGPVTKAAVMLYQEKRGLEVDGVVGPATWNALLS